MPVNVPAAVVLHLSAFTEVRSDGGLVFPSLLGVAPSSNLPITVNVSRTGMDVSDGSPAGMVIDFPSAIDATDAKLFVIGVQYLQGNRVHTDTLANGGFRWRMYSGDAPSVADYRSWTMWGNDSFGASSTQGMVSCVIDLSSTSDHSADVSDVGTYDQTDIQSYSMEWNLADLGIGADCITYYCRIHIFDTGKDDTNIIKFTGTSSFDDLITEVLGTDYTNKIGTWVGKLADSYFVPVAFQIGDSSTATNFDCSGKTIISPPNADAADPRFRYTTDGVRVYAVIRDNAADDVDCRSSIWTYGVATPFDFNISNQSTIYLEGAIFNGMGDFTLGSSCIGGAAWTLASGSNVIVNGADIDGSTINGDCFLNSDTDLTDVIINGDLRVNVAADTTIDLTDCDITGDIFNDATGNTLTVNLTRSTATAGDPGTGDGETNVLTQATIEITYIDGAGNPIEDLQASAFRTDTGEELMNEDTDASGIATELYSTSDTFPFSIVVKGRKAETADDPKYFGIAQIQTLTTSGIFLTITMEEKPDIFT